MEIADVIAHAMHFRFLDFLSHQQVEELGAILVVVQVNLVVQEVAGSVVRRTKRNIRVIKEGKSWW